MSSIYNYWVILHIIENVGASWAADLTTGVNLTGDWQVRYIEMLRLIAIAHRMYG